MYKDSLKSLYILETASYVDYNSKNMPLNYQSTTFVYLNNKAFYKIKSTNKTKVIFNINKQIKILLEILQTTKIEMYKHNIFL